LNPPQERIYRTSEVLKIVGVSRATLYNWFRDKKIKDVARDRNNYRIFNKKDIGRIVDYKNMVRYPLQ